MSAWVLPDHIADVLPSEARHIEELRRGLLDTARGYGYELVMPPMLEHLESLLTGTGHALNLRTFKLIDQASGRSLGLRADSTPQVARIDAHLLNRKGVARLCYSGPVLHTRPASPHASREPLQFGAEIYGHSGTEADLESLQLALDCIRAAKLPTLSVDLADVRLATALLDDAHADPALRPQILDALAAKNAPVLQGLTQSLPERSRQGLLGLLTLYGEASVLEQAQKLLPDLPVIRQSLSELRWLSSHLADVRVSFDLADLGGYTYYSGMRFSIFAQGARDALVRGGRYDEVGAAFGRKRPAVGFGLDIKYLVSVVAPQPLRAAIRAPWSESASLSQAIARLRAQGEIVVCVLPGHESEIDEFHCDRELMEVAGQWVLQAL
ncbi:MAG: hypothetical protein RL468_1272 [Pseudomonadota bacterium]|jgi:ATP phosphoribosyltransferase regulatory subunit